MNLIVYKLHVVCQGKAIIGSFPSPKILAPSITFHSVRCTEQDNIWAAHELAKGPPDRAGPFHVGLISIEWEIRTCTEE